MIDGMVWIGVTMSYWHGHEDCREGRRRRRRLVVVDPEGIFGVEEPAREYFDGAGKFGPHSLVVGDGVRTVDGAVAVWPSLDG